MRFPNTIPLNTFKAYINLKNCKNITNRDLNSFNLEWDCNSPDSLKCLCIQTIAENWLVKPIFGELEFVEDRNYLLDILNVNFPLSEICAHIKDDIFWKRSYYDKWKICTNNITGNGTGTNKKLWIKVFLEKYLSETIEEMKPNEYDPEMIITFLELCGPYIDELKLKQLQPTTHEVGVGLGANGNNGGDYHNDHIPMNLILSNLSELRKLDLTFDIKNIGANFYLGCTNLSQNDVKNFINGLEKCYELREFRLCSTKLEPFMLKMIGRALEKGCPYLESIHLPHCRAGDIGLISFLDVLGRDAFMHLQEINLINNFISQEGALELAEVIKTRPLRYLNMRLNPLTSDGTAAIFSAVAHLPIKELNLACCSIDETIDALLLHLLRSNQTLQSLDLSTNRLGNELGQRILQELRNKENLQLYCFDVRNTGISNDIKLDIEDVILENRHVVDGDDAFT